MTARSFLLALGCLAPISAQAQTRDLDRETPAGRVFQGQFEEDGGPARFVLELPAGEALQLEALPVGGSDPELRVFDESSAELIAHNDDQSGTIAARVRLHSDSSRRVRIEVSRSTSATGAPSARRFTLVILPVEPPAPPRPLVIGERYSGELRSGDEQLFELRAEQGQDLYLSLIAPSGSALDPQLAVFAGRLTATEPLASDDDGAGNLDARVRLTVPEAGLYTVRATGVGSSEGPFELLTEPGLSHAATSEPLELGQATEGELAGNGGSRFYRLSPPAIARLAGRGGSLTIAMTAEPGDSLDPLLEAGFETPLGFTAGRSDDDGGGGLDARLTLDLDAIDDAATWLEHLRIKAGAASGSGAYRIVMNLASSD